MNSAPAPVDAAVTVDAALGGRLRLTQPERGHRFGHDAILLAAATAAAPGETAVDLGAGVGAAGLALARRVAGVAVTLVDNDPNLVALAAANARANELDDRVRAVVADVAASPKEQEAAGLMAGSAARVLMNPPFNSASHNRSPDAARAAAHVATPETLATWVACARRLLAPGGTLTLIWRAEGLADVLAALAGGFGDIRLSPVHGKPDAAAIRVLVRAAAGSRAPLRLAPALMLSDGVGNPTAEAEAILRDAAALPMGD